jgi:hypothetical protein
LYHRHGVTIVDRTVRGQLRRAGLHQKALAAEPKAYGRYEADRPNERWITDMLGRPVGHARAATSGHPPASTRPVIIRKT